MIFIELICKGRGQGKTHDLILESARTGIPILTPYDPKNISYMAKEMRVNIPKPLSIEEYKHYDCHYGLHVNRTCQLLIDDIDDMLEELLKAQIKIASLTPDSFKLKENNIMVKNEDTTMDCFATGRLIYNTFSPLTIIKNSSKVKDVNVIVPDKVVEVLFEDGTKEKAVCRKPDVFSLEQAIAICIGKKIMGGSSAYNNAIKHGLKIYNDKLKKEELDKEEQERIANKRAKRIAYKKRKAAEREQAEKERQIEIQKEAYIRAMTEMKTK